MTSEPDAVLTIGELADYLKIAKSSLYKLAQQGRIPAQKGGRVMRHNDPSAVGRAGALAGACSPLACWRLA